MKKRIELTKLELEQMLIQNNIKIKPSYHHEDYMFTSFTMPYPLKQKLDRISKKMGVTRSKLIQLLINNLEE